MRKEEYQKLVSEYTPKENKWKNAVIAFLVGGLVGFLGQVIVAILQNSFGMETTEACSWLCVIIIFLASLATALGFFDNWVTKCKAGLFFTNYRVCAFSDFRGFRLSKRRIYNRIRFKFL